MLDKLKTHLKTHGASITPSRLAVFKYLQAHDRTPTQSVISGLPQYDQASVYRTITLFKELGIIQDVIANRQKMIELTDAFDSHHHHISCQNCGRSVTVEDPALERRLRQLAIEHGITPLAHQIEVTGLCTDCAAAVSQDPH
jgi:Fe2+ or Zn2+ uptake regulation protein